MKRTFLIAEAGQVHEVSLDIAHSYIDALLADTVVYAVKFQTHIADAESNSQGSVRDSVMKIIEK